MVPMGQDPYAADRTVFMVTKSWTHTRIDRHSLAQRPFIRPFSPPAKAALSEILLGSTLVIAQNR